MDRFTPRLVQAKSDLKFPTLSNSSSCPWHEDCTPMDCEYYTKLPPNHVLQARINARMQRGRHSK